MEEINAAIPLLMREWSMPDGFFWRLREGHFDSDGVERLVRILEPLAQDTYGSDAIDTSAVISRKFVALAWYIPLFLRWQQERLMKREGDTREFVASITRIEGLLERVLGVP